MNERYLIFYFHIFDFRIFQKNPEITLFFCKIFLFYHRFIIAQSMVQMEWHDGTHKNVHVDPVILFNYQNHLKNAIAVYQKRVKWLQGSSRRYYGCIVEKRYSSIEFNSLEI